MGCLGFQLGDYIVECLLNLGLRCDPGELSSSIDSWVSSEERCLTAVGPRRSVSWELVRKCRAWLPFVCVAVLVQGLFVVVKPLVAGVADEREFVDVGLASAG